MPENKYEYYSGPVKKEYLAHCKTCEKEVDFRWNYCPACGAKVCYSDNQPYSAKTVVDPQIGQ